MSDTIYESTNLQFLSLYIVQQQFVFSFIGQNRTDEGRISGTRTYTQYSVDENPIG